MLTQLKWSANSGSQNSPAAARGPRPASRFVWAHGALFVMLAVASGMASRASEPTGAEERAFREAVARVAGAVVRIEPVVASEAAVGQGAEAVAGTGASTGLVLDPAGWVLTTAFAVPRDVAETVIVRPDGGRQAARAVGRDLPRGLVLLETEPLPDAPPLEIVPRDELSPGQWTIAVGRGWAAATPAVSVGILSAVDRAWGRAVQTDASVSPANYGGPLIDIRGRVIGILAPLPADTAGMNLGTELYDAGIGFAVPLEGVARVRSRLEAGETLAGGILGISYRSDDLINGDPVIASCRQGSPAAEAGLRPGDRIVVIDGQAVTRIADARHRIAARYAGDTITIDVARGEEPAKKLAVQATLAASLPPWRQPMLGVVAAAGGDNEPRGVQVEWVLPQGPADAAGLRAGDVIESLKRAEPSTDDKDRAVEILRDAPDLAGRLAGAAPGERVTLAVRQGETSRDIEVTTAPLDPRLPNELPPLADVAAGDDAATVVRLAAAEVAEPALAVLPAGAAKTPVGVLIFCGPPRGKVADADATAWKATVARHGIAVILVGSADPQRWSRDDIDGVKRALAALHARRPIDPRRVAVAGTAAGGSFAWLVAERLPGMIRGVALQAASLPRQSVIPTAEPGQALWVLLDDAAGDLGRRVADDRRRLEHAGHAVGTLPTDSGDAIPTDALGRWVRVLGMM